MELIFNYVVNIIGYSDLILYLQ